MRKINIIIALIVIVFTSNVFAGDRNEEKKIKAKARAEKVSERIDYKLKLEAWMTDLKDFNPFQLISVDEEFSMESWMTETFKVNTSYFQDTDLSMENWMTEPFKISKNNADMPLDMEAWMTEIFKVK
jgi:hypothetical protein